jgi:hypothetical protein
MAKKIKVGDEEFDLEDKDYLLIKTLQELNERIFALTNKL